MTSLLAYDNDSFFNFARDHYHEFSTLRRAKHSTLNILYELHTEEPESDKYNYNCDNCKTLMRNMTWYHCRVCDVRLLLLLTWSQSLILSSQQDYDLCVGCKQKIGHVHEMNVFGPDLVDRTLPKYSAEADLHIRTQFDQSVIQTFEHLCICQESNCPVPFCRKMKCTVGHMTFCTNNCCNICSCLKPLFEHHAKNCQNVNCLYLLCFNVERNAVQQEQQRSSERYFLNVSRLQFTNPNDEKLFFLECSNILRSRYLK